MESILPTNEYTEVEGRAYLNPQVGIDESNTFIDNLRATQGQQNQEIFTDTQMLGTDVPSDIGGLTGANSYFTSRYQTPMTNAAIGSLRATAQAAALNQVLANEQAIWKKRYQDAYRNYQKRQYNRSRYGGGNGGGGGNATTEGGVDYNYTDSGDREVGSVEPSYSPMGSGDFSYTSNESRLSNGGALSTNSGPLEVTNNLLPNGSVNIQRDKFGKITSLTYNGKTFTGDAAQQRYNFLQNSGTIGGKR